MKREITPAEAQAKIAAGEPMRLIDVREPAEFQITRIPGAQLVPMDNVPASLPALEELAEQGTLVVFCHHGVRSLRVVDWLRQQGLTNCVSMAGGIERWSLEVDPSVPRY